MFSVDVPTLRKCLLYNLMWANSVIPYCQMLFFRGTTYLGCLILFFLLFPCVRSEAGHSLLYFMAAIVIFLNCALCYWPFAPLFFFLCLSYVSFHTIIQSLLWSRSFSATSLFLYRSNFIRLLTILRTMQALVPPTSLLRSFILRLYIDYSS